MYWHVMKAIFCLMMTLLPILQPLSAHADEEKKPTGPPPMLVEVAKVEQGSATPLVDLVGTVRFGRVSRVASEVSGIVEKILFNEGAYVKSGNPLVELRTDLLQTTLTGTRASYEQVLVELERARKDLQRISALYEEKSVAEALYDENYYAVRALEKKAAALKANLEHQQLELQKATISAPFSGLVQSKLTEQGEWVSSGSQVAVLADNRDLEVHVDVPQNLLDFLQTGVTYPVRVAGEKYLARFIHFIPRGDIATRTFTVKLKLQNAEGLIEGMEAHVQLPSGPKTQSLLVPRDAVINQFGNDVLFLAVDGKAKMVPVQVNGYQGMQVAVTGEGLDVGQQVVVKGNERIRDGQAIRF